MADDEWTRGVDRRTFLRTGAMVAGALTIATPAPAATAPAAEPACDTAPTGLLTSLLDDPVGVATSGARLSWIVPAIGPAPTQSAYQVQWADLPFGFDRRGSLVWDSGRIPGTASTAVPYQGPELRTSTAYWWRVRTWTGGGQVSGWSAPQRVITEAATWAGVPIWVGGNPQPDWALLRTEFDLPSVPLASAFVQATGQSPEGARQYVYKLWANDSVVGQGSVRAMSGEARYHTHDLAAVLRPGRNALGALCYSAAGQQFLAQVVLRFADGTSRTIGTDGSWRASSGAMLLPANGFTGGGYFGDPQEFWDLRQEPVGWTGPGFDDSSWQPASTSALPSSLAPATVNVDQELVNPASITQTSPGTWLVDLGQEIAGGLHVHLHGTAGTTVTVLLGEELNSDGGVRYQLRAGNTYREVWTLRDGWQDIEHWGYRGFRWAQLITDPGIDLRRAVQGVALHSAWHEEDSSFDCSSPGLTRVWQFARYSIKATALDVYQDTPTRERGPYEGDAYVNQRSQYAVQRSFGLARYSGSFLVRRPSWPTEYHLMSVLSAWADYLATGDPDQLAADYDYYVAKNFPLGADGLVHKPPGTGGFNTDLVDWPASERDGYVFTEVNTVVNAFQYAAYTTLAQVATVLGKSADATTYAGMAEQVRNGINTQLLPAGANAYVDGAGTAHTAQHATAFPVALGAAEDANLPAFGQFLAGGGMRTSVYAAQFLLDALFAAGQANAAHALLTATTMTSWLHMLDDLHATIVMEAWNPSLKGNTTFSHAWGSAPANVVAHRILGVNVTGAGASTVEIQPQPGPLIWMNGTVPTIRGPVSVSLDRRAGRLAVGLPPNVSGRIVLDSALGTAAPSVPGPVVSRSGNSTVIEDVRPGTTTVLLSPVRHP